MERFHIIEEACSIISHKGIYRQSKVFRKGVDIYASIGTGFVRLYSAGGTSHPKISWHEIEGPGIAYEKGKTPKWDNGDK